MHELMLSLSRMQRPAEGDHDIPSGSSHQLAGRPRIGDWQRTVAHPIMTSTECTVIRVELPRRWRQKNTGIF